MEAALSPSLVDVGGIQSRQAFHEQQLYISLQESLIRAVKQTPRSMSGQGKPELPSALFSFGSREENVFPCPLSSWSLLP